MRRQQVRRPADAAVLKHAAKSVCTRDALRADHRGRIQPYAHAEHLGAEVARSAAPGRDLRPAPQVDALVKHETVFVGIGDGVLRQLQRLCADQAVVLIEQPAE